MTGPLRTTVTPNTSAHTGHVAEFDSAVGLGLIESVGGVHYPFHCMEIADGSREIPVGVDVTFVLLAKFGRFEAADIRS